LISLHIYLSPLRRPPQPLGHLTVVSNLLVEAEGTSDVVRAATAASAGWQEYVKGGRRRASFLSRLYPPLRGGGEVVTPGKLSELSIVFPYKFPGGKLPGLSFVFPCKFPGGKLSGGGEVAMGFVRPKLSPPELSGVRVRPKLLGDNFPGGGMSSGGCPFRKQNKLLQNHHSNVIPRQDGVDQILLFLLIKRENGRWF